MVGTGHGHLRGEGQGGANTSVGASSRSSARSSLGAIATGHD